MSHAEVNRERMLRAARASRLPVYPPICECGEATRPSMAGYRCTACDRVTTRSPSDDSWPTAGGAIIAGPYRFLLWRDVSDRPGLCTFVMLNPSTADARCDDQTVRRCRGYCERWGYGRLAVVNLYAWRATHPRDLAAFCSAHGEAHVIGGGNDAVIEACAGGSQRVVLAWGNLSGWARPRSRDVAWRVRRAARMAQTKADVVTLGELTSAGYPRHPSRGPLPAAPNGEVRLLAHHRRSARG